MWIDRRDGLGASINRMQSPDALWNSRTEKSLSSALGQRHIECLLSQRTKCWMRCWRTRNTLRSQRRWNAFHSQWRKEMGNFCGAEWTFHSDVQAENHGSKEWENERFGDCAHLHSRYGRHRNLQSQSIEVWNPRNVASANSIDQCQSSANQLAIERRSWTECCSDMSELWTLHFVCWNARRGDIRLRAGDEVGEVSISVRSTVGRIRSCEGATRTQCCIRVRNGCDALYDHWIPGPRRRRHHARNGDVQSVLQRIWISYGG